MAARRPPNLSIATAQAKSMSAPILIVPDSADEKNNSDLDYPPSSPSSHSSSSSANTTPHDVESDATSDADDITKDLEALEQMRLNVRKNLRLRPITSVGNLPKVDVNSPFKANPDSPSWKDSESSPTSSLGSPTFYTPLSEDTFNQLDLAPLASDPEDSPGYPNFPELEVHPPSALEPPPLPRLLLSPKSRSPRALEPTSLYRRLLSPKRPLLIDTRPPQFHLVSYIQNSINIQIPSLILKRCKKPGGGFPSLDSLRQFITTEQSKGAWDELMAPGGPWDGDVVIYDDEMDPNDKNNPSIASWALMPVIAPLLTDGVIDYLKGGMSAARFHLDFSRLLVSGGEFDFGDQEFDEAPVGKKGGPAGLFQLDTIAATTRNKNLPEVERSALLSTLSSSRKSTGGLFQINTGISSRSGFELPAPPPPRSPLPVMSSVISSSSHRALDDHDPSPPPSQLAFRKPAAPNRRPSAPNLRKLDTKSAERLKETGLRKLDTKSAERLREPPKLSVRTNPAKSNTLALPGLSITAERRASPSHFQLVHSDEPSPTTGPWDEAPSPGANGQTAFAKTPFTSYYTPPHTPHTPRPPSPKTPKTARQDDQPPSAEEGLPAFAISCILPNFLYLGPELATEEQLEEAQSLGIRRILNMAVECNDDKGLELKSQMEKYHKIPWRDTVEEEKIAVGIRQVCDILDDASLHSAPTYVHCKAGKSRSVTAVMAYLIHANHWTLSQAYAFVLERRKGVSPNIGFVSELMTFEEEELGGKSNGVQPTDGDGDGHETVSYGGGARQRGVRESLPPVHVTQNGDGTFAFVAGPMSADLLSNARVGDSGQEMEIKDSHGRYRHARRAPVDRATLQPMRRVSKAGLESSAYLDLHNTINTL